MATYYGKSPDSTIKDWYTRIEQSGGIVSRDFTGNVYTMVDSLKSNGVWDKLYEVYVLCGGDYTSCLQKLKYGSGKSSTLSVSGFSSGTYRPTGSIAGFVSNTGIRTISTGVLYTDLSSTNRSVGVYETSRSASYYSTWIGREGGGGNSAFGPTINPDGTGGLRYMDCASAAALATNSSVNAAGLFSTIANASSVMATSYGLQYSSNSTLGALNGAGGYVIGGAIGGGGYCSGSFSFAYLGYGMSSTQLSSLDLAVNNLMKTVGCNLY